jgi:hypothetical protein
MIKTHLVNHVRAEMWIMFPLNNSFLQAWRGSLSLEVGQTRSVNITKEVCTNKLYCLLPTAVHLLVPAYHDVLLYKYQSKLTTTYCCTSLNPSLPQILLPLCKLYTCVCQFQESINAFQNRWCNTKPLKNSARYCHKRTRVFIQFARYVCPLVKYFAYSSAVFSRICQFKISLNSVQR